MKKTKALRQLIKSPQLSFLMESHTALSAKIVQETGFEGIWASGLGISATMGVRDSNELSWTQVLEILEFMNDAVTIPILLDGDTGYGNFNNLRLLVQKLESRGIAGVCIEDKLFPKTNSLLNCHAQPLAEIDEFCGKIKAGKDTQKDPDFCIVARVEALIAGWGLNEAVKRAEEYRKAGADAILIHSKQRDASEIVAFAREWARRLPLVIVPTTYYTTPVEVYREYGINVVIWANHLLRGTIAALKKLAHRIYHDQSVVSVEDKIEPLGEIFRLQGVNELLEAEERYLRTSQNQKPNAIILAASRGKELQDLTLNRPKTMISIAGKPILLRLVDDLKDQGVNDITVVSGYMAESINVPGISLVLNPDYSQSKDLSSLHYSINMVGKNTIIVYGDLLVRRYITRDLLETKAPVSVVVDSDISEKLKNKASGDYVKCSKQDDRGIFNSEVRLLRIYNKGDSFNASEIDGQWIGMMRVNGRGYDWLKVSLELLSKKDNFHQLSITDLLNHIVQAGHPVSVMYINRHWLDVNELLDIEKAGDFAQDIAL